VDDVTGLLAYLADEAHVQLGACFRAALADALVCDFEMTDGADALTWLARRPG
jgi:hypothetical protein